MVVRMSEVAQRPSYAGLRMSADEYLALPEDDRRFELIDGLVVMFPGPTPNHQAVLGELLFQIGHFVRDGHLGVVIHSVDVQLDPQAVARPVVYRPDIIFVRAQNVSKIKGRVAVTPDLVVEVISPDYRALDEVTKRGDYELAGVAEYWIVDPEQKSFTFLRLRDGRYEQVAVDGDHFASAVVAGFKLDLAAIREHFGKF